MAAQDAARGAFRIASGQLQGSRKRQEDACLMMSSGPYQIALVADGLGGHLHGDLASRVAVNTAAECLSDRVEELHSNMQEALRDVFLSAHRAVANLDAMEPSFNSPGSTLSIVVFEPKRRRAHLASVGDSPILLLRDGEMETLAGWGEPGGTLSYCLGGDVGGPTASGVTITEAPLELLSGDRVLIASDGIFTLDDRQLVEALSGPTSRAIVEQLLLHVIAAQDPEQDNCTVILLEVL